MIYNLFAPLRKPGRRGRYDYNRRGFLDIASGLADPYGSGFYEHRQAKRTVFYLIVIAACGVVYRFLFQSGSHVEPKGAQPHQGWFALVLYISTALGMLSHYLYDHFTEPRRSRQPFDVGNLLAPLLISPLVFMPLLTAFQNADIDLANLTAPPSLMMVLVAFQNGFFWREIFDKRRKGR